MTKIAVELKVSKPRCLTGSGTSKRSRQWSLRRCTTRFYLSAHKRVDFFWEIFSQIQHERGTRDLSGVSTDKLFSKTRTSTEKRSTSCLSLHFEAMMRSALTDIRRHTHRYVLLRHSSRVTKLGQKLTKTDRIFRTTNCGVATE